MRYLIIIIVCFGLGACVRVVVPEKITVELVQSDHKKETQAEYIRRVCPYAVTDYDLAECLGF